MLVGDQAIAAGHEVTRSTVRFGSEGDLAQATELLRGHDVVISCLGTRPWRHVDICSGGTRVICAAMAAAGVRRLIVMSSLGVGDSKIGGVEGAIANALLGRSFRDKGKMEEELRATTLDWVCVRPGRLTNGPARGIWRTADDGSLVGGKISRADVAAFMLAQLTLDEWVRRRPVLVW
jgi:putative NADH-flavin reductase